MRVLDIGTMSPDLTAPGAEMVDGNVDAADDPEEKIGVEWVGGDPPDTLQGTFDMILMTHSLRYNQGDYENAESKVADAFVNRIHQLTHKGSWFEIVDWLEDVDKRITKQQYVRRFIKPFVDVGFEVDVMMFSVNRIFCRMKRK